MQRHLEFMYWSYVGLVAAFVAEVGLRLPLLLGSDRSLVDIADRAREAQNGFVMAVIAMVVVMAVGEYGFRNCRSRWFKARLIEK